MTRVRVISRNQVGEVLRTGLVGLKRYFTVRFDDGEVAAVYETDVREERDTGVKST